MKRFAFALVAASTLTAAQADMFKPSKADQVKLGQRAAEDLRKKEKVLPATDPKVRLLKDIGRKLLATVDDSKEPWKYTFDVIESKEVNAFALPGGPVFFYTGLLNKLSTEDEIAGILSHELTHVRREHWAYAYADSQKRALGITALLMIFRANTTVANIASIGNDVLVGLPFSRKHETEADMMGLDMMVKAGYNPNGMADVFRLLKSLGGSKPPEILSTHPDDGKRIQRIEGKIKDMNRSYPPQIPLPWPPEKPKT